MYKRVTPAAAIMLAVLTGGCSWLSENEPRQVTFPGVYRIDIQQGNRIEQNMLDQLRPGMTHDQVLYVMGSPLLEDSYNNQWWGYIYSYQKGGHTREQKQLTLIFRNGVLAGYRGDVKVPGLSVLAQDSS